MFSYTISNTVYVLLWMYGTLSEKIVINMGKQMTYSL